MDLSSNVTETNASTIQIQTIIDSVKLCGQCDKYYDTIKTAWINEVILCQTCQNVNQTNEHRRQLYNEYIQIRNLL
jgi:hypothetical protein